MMMRKIESPEINRRIRMSTREIAIAVALTLIACVFLVAALLAPATKDAVAPDAPVAGEAGKGG